MAQAVPQNNHSIGKQAVIWDENWRMKESKGPSLSHKNSVVCFCDLFCLFML